jgi:hypothetical protein
MITATFSDSYRAKMARIKRLPVYYDQAMMGRRKKDGLNLIDIFHTGIKDNLFGLDALAKLTIKAKQRKGYERPTSPLYGKGDKEIKKSYSNMLRLRRLKKGWKIFASSAMHWSGNIKLRDLLTVHEEGRTIKRTTKNGEILIRIPPRPAFWRSYRKLMDKIQTDRKEQSKEVKAAVNEYINKGELVRFNKMTKYEKEAQDKEE